MKAPFRNPFIRMGLLILAMVTAFLLGRLHGAAQFDTANQKPVEAKRPKTPLELASIKNLTPEQRKQLNSIKLGNVTLSRDQMGRFYVDGEDLSMLAMTDPKEALALLAKLPHGAMTSDAYRSVFNKWASNPQTTALAAAAAAELPQSPDKTSALIGVADAWVSQDPKAALDWASGLVGVNGSAFREALVATSQMDPALAAQYVGMLPKATARNDVILTIAQSWANGSKGDPGATLDWLDQVATGTTYDRAVQSIFFNFARTDPSTGAALVDKLIDPVDRSTAISQLSQSWSRNDPGATLDWLQTLPSTDSVASAAALSSVLTNWSKRDLQSAVNYVDGVTDPAVFQTVAPLLAPAMARQDPQAALSWVNGFPDSAAKSQAISGVLTTMAATDFSGAWNYASNLPTGAGRDGAMDSLVSTLSSRDPAQAAALLGQLGSDAAVLSATTTVASNWAQRDPAGLTAWINTQPTGDLRDAAVVQYVSNQAAKDPAAAFAMANTIANQTTRTTYVKSAIVQMAKKDMTAATQAIQTANIQDAQRQNILMTITQVPGK